MLPVLLVLGSVLGYGTCARILFIPPIFSPSHKLMFIPWADELALRGHEVVMWSPVLKPDKYVTKVAKTVQFEIALSDPIMAERAKNMNDSLIQFITWTLDSSIALEPIFMYMSVSPVNDLLSRHREEFDKVTSQEWDLILIDELFNIPGYLIPALTNSPVAVITTTTLTNFAASYAGLPNPPSWIPVMGNAMCHSDRMSYLQRLQNFVWYMINVNIDRLSMYLVTREMRKFFPNIPNLSQSRMNPHFIFVNHVHGLDFARPLLPNMGYVGGIHLKREVDPIPANLLETISNYDGVIMISMGHIVNWDSAPASAFDAFVGGLSRMSSKYLVLWQYKARKQPRSLPDNVKLLQWLPQIALLSHSRLRVFVSHCGGNGAIEASNAGVPVLAIPFFGDQYDNAARLVARGGAIRINKRHLTSDLIYSSIMKIITEPSYKENMTRLQKVIKAQLNSPLERAIHWTEFIVNNSDENYLRPDAVHHLSLLQYYCVDLLLTLAVLFYLCYRIAKFAIHGFLKLVWSSKKSIVKVKNQ